MKCFIFLSFLLTGTCGQSVNSEISGSLGPTQPHEYPFMVRLDIAGDRCGASLISPRFLATAYHCFYNKDCRIPGTCYAVIGEHNTTKVEAGEKKINIKMIHSPSGTHWNPMTPSGNSDLALAELESPVELDEKAQGVRVAEERLTVNSLVWSLGWGMTYNGTLTEVLHKVQLRVSEVDLQGEVTYTRVGKNANNIPVDPCGGDSGGPLLARRDGEWHLYATLYGAGFDCDTNSTNGDGAWNSLAPHKDWIQEILNKAGEPTPTGTTKRPNPTDMPTVYTQQPDKIQLKKNNLITTLPRLGKEWEISFEFKPENHDQSGFTNILHLTIGEDVTQIGDRIPAIFYHPDTGLHVATAIGNDANSHTDIMPTPPVGKWTSIVVSQLKSGSKTTFRVNVDGAAPFSVENPEPKEFSNVKVFASDPWWDTQPGSIRGLTIKTK